jgi:16S rRNA (guanine(966)-N(2))-methyltransferase RsmD
MRIIGGRKKGTVLKPLKGMALRPMKDNSRENIFNIITNYFEFEEINALDLFSGTGSVSYELASRGVPEVVAVDQHPASTTFIEAEAERLALPEITVIRMDVFDYLKAAISQFDLIIIDPPFALEGKQALIDLIIERQVLAPKGWIIMEHFKKESFEGHPNLRRTRKYGKSVFSFFGYTTDKPTP